MPSGATGPAPGRPRQLNQDPRQASIRTYAILVQRPPRLSAHGRGALLTRLRSRGAPRARSSETGLSPADQGISAEPVHPARLPELRGVLLQRRGDARGACSSTTRSPSSHRSETRSTATRSTSRLGPTTTTRTSGARCSRSSRRSSSPRRTPRRPTPPTSQATVETRARLALRDGGYTHPRARLLQTLRDQ